jgi:hypothetical protein
MKIFEPHIHMYARTTEDYERIAKSGIKAVLEPSFWLGEPRKHPGTFFDYFDHLLGFEAIRAKKYGIKHFTALSLNPKESNNELLFKDVLKELPRYLSNENVLAVGEIGFDSITPQEEESLVKQLLLAKDFSLPVLVHLPHMEKLKGVKRILSILKELNYDMEKVLMDHNDEKTTPLCKEVGVWRGYTIYPITKLSPGRAADIIEYFGMEKALVNSSADWGPSDPLSVVFLAEELRRRGFGEEKLQRLLWDNPYNFFAQSGRLIGELA